MQEEQHAATQFIEQEINSVEVPKNAIHSAIAKLRFHEDDAHKFVERLRARKRSGTEQNLNVSLNSKTHVAESILRTYRGARQLAARCMDVAFWDASHDVSRYAYKLSATCFIDSVAKTIFSVFHLTLHENEKTIWTRYRFGYHPFRFLFHPFYSNV